VAAAGHPHPIIGLSNHFKVRGGLATLSVGVPASVAAGADFSIKLTARDEVGNVLTDFAGPVDLTDVLGSLSSDPVVFSAGVATVSARVATPTHADRITASGPGGITGMSRVFKVTGVRT
jgi:hypothetical protein